MAAACDVIYLTIVTNNNNTLYYSVKSSSKATQSSLIGDTDHNTGISLPRKPIRHHVVSLNFHGPIFLTWRRLEQ